MNRNQAGSLDISVIRMVENWGSPCFCKIVYEIDPKRIDVLTDIWYQELATGGDILRLGYDQSGHIRKLELYLSHRLLFNDQVFVTESLPEWQVSAGIVDAPEYTVAKAAGRVHVQWHSNNMLIAHVDGVSPCTPSIYWLGDTLAIGMDPEHNVRLVVMRRFSLMDRHVLNQLVSPGL